MRRIWTALLMLAFVAWTITPLPSHVPIVVETLQEHADMIKDHGHSHGFEDDILWAMHGHSHDVADHDHSQVLIIPVRFAQAFDDSAPVWRRAVTMDWSSPNFRFERPPRA